MTPEDGPVEITPDPFGLLLPDGLGPVAQEGVPEPPPGTHAEMRAREVIEWVDLDAL